MKPVTIEMNSVNLTDEQFFQLCIKNRNFRFERNSQGDLVIMSPTGGETSNRNIEIAYQLQAWNRKTKLGIAFDSSGGFKLPKGGDRSPDASWIPLAKWNSLTPEQQRRFLPLCPDFLIELLSATDSLKDTRKKMLEYMSNGCKLAWLINRKDKKVEIYREGKEVEILDHPVSLSGENILPEFVLEMELIW
jgi:Uma2 family endonuclease